jgi:cytochrome P450
MLPPGPRTPLVWQTIQFLFRPKKYVAEVKAKYGDAIRFHSLLGRGIAVTEASLAREVFASPPENFEVIDAVGGLFGTNAVIATAGATHKRQRKLLNPPFHGARVKALLSTMQRVIADHIARLGDTKPGDVVAMTSITQAMTLDVILETVFGAGTSNSDLDRGRKVLHSMVHDFSPALIATDKLHTPLFPPWRKYARARRDFDQWVAKLIADRRRKGEPGEDLLGLFLTTKYDDGEPMADTEIHDHLVTLLLAGHETSAIAIAWATYWLLREPAVLARLREELALLGPNPTAEELARHPYLNAVGSESLRIEPIVTDVIRRCRLETRIGPWTIPAGEHVAVMIGSILSDPRVFAEPERFKPERFLERKYHPGEFLPFGGGQRRCLGAVFAEAELAIAIATIATAYDLELADANAEHSVRRNITMGPARGVRIKVRGKRPLPVPRPTAIAV